jgi:hypothetical protein
MQDVGNSQNIGSRQTYDSASSRDEEACCILLAHLLVDMWQRAGPAASFSLACMLLKRYALPSLPEEHVRVPANMLGASYLFALPCL